MVPDFVVTELLDINPDEGIISLRGNRMLLFRADSLFRLREELVRNLGEDMARNILTRFGYRCGHFDVMASREFFTFKSDADWMLAGPMMHTLEGMVHATCDELKFDRQSGAFLMRGIWRNSYEAENYLLKYGRAKEPVCWTLTGYTSGFGSGFMGRDVVCVETMCRGMGDPYCRYEMRSLEEWNGQAARNIKDLNRNTVLKNFQTLLEEERERAKTWQAMNQAIIDISTNLSSSNMPVKTVDYAQKLLRAQKAVMAVVTERKKRILLYETMGREKINTRVLTESSGLVTSILESREPVESYGVPRAIQGLDIEIKGLLGIPLYLRKELIGALIVINKSGGGQFSQHDREILGFLGAHSAVALGNARVYEHTNQKLQENIAELYRVNSLLLAEHEALQKSTHIHNRLTSLVLEGHGLEEIGRNLAVILSRPVIIADQFFNIISSSVPGGGAGDIGQVWQDTIQEARFREKMATLFAEKRLINIAAAKKSNPQSNLVVASIMAGSDNLGFVATLEGNRPLSQLDCMAVEHAGTVIALDLLKQKASFETERRLKKDFLEELLEGKLDNEEVIIRRAEKLGLDLTGTFRVVAIDFIPKAAVAPPESYCKGKSLFQAVDRVVSQVSPNIVVIGKKVNIIGLLILDETREKQAATHLRNMTGEMERRFNDIFPDYIWRAGISSPCRGVSGFAASYQEACITIDIIKSLNYRNKCQAHELLGVFGLLNINAEQFKKFIDRVIGPLLKYDEKHNSHLVQTLMLYFNNNCNIQKAARNGFMNSSTMKYRLRRISEIAGINLSHPETNLQVQLALKMIEGMR
ncbi:MAG: XylR N-terminal domain-containing protein [Bacillota bacterium]